MIFKAKLILITSECKNLYDYKTYIMSVKINKNKSISKTNNFFQLTQWKLYFGSSREIQKCSSLISFLNRMWNPNNEYRAHSDLLYSTPGEQSGNYTTEPVRWPTDWLFGHTPTDSTAKLGRNTLLSTLYRFCFWMIYGLWATEFFPYLLN